MTKMNNVQIAKLTTTMRVFCEWALAHTAEDGTVYMTDEVFALVGNNNYYSYPRYLIGCGLWVKTMKKTYRWNDGMQQELKTILERGF